MFLGSDVAEQRRTGESRQGSSDGRGDVVVPRGDVGDQGPQNIEGGLVADSLLHLNVHGDLIHRDMAGTLDHYLDILVPSPSSELPQRLQLGELRRIRGIRQTTRPEAVSRA